MTWNRSLSTSFVLVMSSPAWGQVHHPANRGGNAGGARPGQIHPGAGQHGGMIAPQHQMENEFWQHQMMLMEMMAPRRPARHPAQTQGTHGASGSGGNAQSFAGQGQNGSGQPQRGMHNQANSSKASHDHSAQTPSSESTDPRLSHANSKKGKQDEAASRESRHAHDMETRKTHSTQKDTANRNTRAADNRMAASLRNVQGILHKADTDYQGHRVKAMNHVAEAINRLGGNSMARMDYEYGGTNLPQAQSDRMLDDAMFHLRRIDGELGTGATALAHHRHARTSVVEAIHELETARRIR
jgi:hypothetical protein